LPYLKIIHNISPHSTLYLLTQENERWSIERKKELQQELSAYNIVVIPQQYHRFGFKKLIFSVVQFLELYWIVLSKKVSHIHAFCTPAGATGYILSLLSGRKLVIDSYEPHAESMIETQTWSKESGAFKLLWWLEKKQTSRADYCIAAAKGMEEYAKRKYGITLDHFGVRPACVDLDRFLFDKSQRDKIRKQLGWEDKYVCVYAGKFGGIYLDQEVFDFFKVAFEYWGDRFRVLLLTNNSEDEIVSWMEKAHLPENIIHWEAISYTQMPAYLSAADFAITPVKPVPSKKYCTPIKDGEYWAIGLPVVITKDISDDSEIIRNYNAGYVINQLNMEEYLNAIKKIEELLTEENGQLRSRIRRIAEQYRHYSIAFNEYSKIYHE